MSESTKIKRILDGKGELKLTEQILLSENCIYLHKATVRNAQGKKEQVQQKIKGKLVITTLSLRFKESQQDEAE